MKNSKYISPEELRRRIDKGEEYIINIIRRDNNES